MVCASCTRDVLVHQRSAEVVATSVEHLAGAVDANGFLVLTPEQAEELKKLEQASRDARKELREVQRSLRSEIERTGSGLMMLNVVAWPLFVALLATMWISLRYRRQRAA
jgi:hypothetical protein